MIDTSEEARKARLAEIQLHLLGFEWLKNKWRKVVYYDLDQVVLLKTTKWFQRWQFTETGALRSSDGYTLFVGELQILIHFNLQLDRIYTVPSSVYTVRFKEIDIHKALQPEQG